MGLNTTPHWSLFLQEKNKPHNRVFRALKKLPASVALQPYPVPTCCSERPLTSHRAFPSLRALPHAPSGPLQPAQPSLAALLLLLEQLIERPRPNTCRLTLSQVWR